MIKIPIFLTFIVLRLSCLHYQDQHHMKHTYHTQSNQNNTDIQNIEEPSISTIEKAPFKEVEEDDYKQDKLGGDQVVENPENDQDFKKINQFLMKEKKQLNGAKLISVKRQVVAGWKYTVKYQKEGVKYTAVLYLQPDRKTIKLRSWEVEQQSEQRQDTQQKTNQPRDEPDTKDEREQTY